MHTKLPVIFGYVIVSTILVAIVDGTPTPEQQDVIENLEILYKPNIEEKFPSEFQIKIASLSKSSLQFEKIKNDAIFIILTSIIMMI